MLPSRLHAVIPAAGVGARMGATVPKQYLPLCGEPMLAQTLRRIAAVPQLCQIVVPLGPQDGYWPEIDPVLRERVERVDGGRERADSVLAGLKQLLATAEPLDLVLVHDAARPCIRVGDIEKLIAAVQVDPARGGLLASPVRDTMKRGGEGDKVYRTESRTDLWHALTPQLFQLQPLHDAIESALRAELALTDESSAIELAGLQPQLVEGGSDNIKVTREGDLALAAFLLNA